MHFSAIPFINHSLSLGIQKNDSIDRYFLLYPTNKEFHFKIETEFFLADFYFVSSAELIDFSS